MLLPVLLLDGDQVYMGVWGVGDHWVSSSVPASGWAGGLAGEW